MAVYVIAAILSQPTGEGNTRVKPFMKVVLLNYDNVEQEAVDFMRKEFLNSVEAKEGWTMVEGDPVMFELHQGHVEKWGPLISPAPEILKPAPPF